MDKKINVWKEKPELFAVILAIGAAVLMTLVSGVSSILYMKIPVLNRQSVYLAQLLCDAISFLVFYGLFVRLGYRKILKERKLSFVKSIGVGAYAFITYSLNTIVQFIANIGKEVQPVNDIVIFVLTVIFIGLAEELFFRGIITNLLWNAYGDTKAGVRYSVLISSIIFGCFHLTNMLSGIEPIGVLVQVVLTSAIGGMFAAIYLRTRNFWFVVFLHSLLDFGGLVSSGIYKVTSIQETIGGYSLINMIGLIPLIIVVLVLLRNQKCQEIVEDYKQQNELEIAITTDSIVNQPLTDEVNDRMQKTEDALENELLQKEHVMGRKLTITGVGYAIAVLAVIVALAL